MTKYSTHDYSEAVNHQLISPLESPVKLERCFPFVRITEMYDPFVVGESEMLERACQQLKGCQFIVVQFDGGKKAVYRRIAEVSLSALEEAA